MLYMYLVLAPRILTRLYALYIDVLGLQQHVLEFYSLLLIARILTIPAFSSFRHACGMAPSVSYGLLIQTYLVFEPSQAKTPVSLKTSLHLWCSYLFYQAGFIPAPAWTQSGLSVKR